MPTGYTAAVQNGSITEFSAFALQCARAFGALIEMRDEPADAPIPQEFKPSDYNAKALAEAQTKHARLLAMTPDEMGAAAAAAHETEMARWRERQERKVAERSRYEAMLAKVKAWTPPSIDHAEFKTFMTQQLTESIKFDCSTSDWDKEPVGKTGIEWHAEQLKSVKRDIDYHTKGHAEEVSRTNDRNQWVRLLRESLATKEPAL